MSRSSESLEAGGGRKREREGVHGGRGRYVLWRRERAGERRQKRGREESRGKEWAGEGGGGLGGMRQGEGRGGGGGGAES